MHQLTKKEGVGVGDGFISRLADRNAGHKGPEDLARRRGGLGVVLRAW